MKEINSSCRFILFAMILDTILLLMYQFFIYDYRVFEIFQYGIVIICYYYGYLIFFKQYKIDFKKILKSKSINPLSLLLDLVFYMFIIMIFGIIYGVILSLLSSGEGEISANIDYDIINIIIICLVAPIAEEIMFRGFIYNVLRKKGTYIAIIVSSLLFGLFHFNIVQLFSTIFLGILCCLINNKYKSIIPGILLHICNNLNATISDLCTMPEKPFYLIIMIVIVVNIYIIINIKDKKFNLFKNIKLSFKMLFKSISFYIIIGLNILIFILNYFNIIKGLY